MRAEYLNCFPDTELKTFARMIKSANELITIKKLRYYGLNEEISEMTRDQSSFGIKAIQNVSVLKEISDNYGEELKILGRKSHSEKFIKFQKNPFKQKLRQTLGLQN